MPERVEAIVKPELLKWARESIGLTVELAAKKAGVKSEQIASWERAETKPTIKQLRTLANIYKRPIAVFYLSEPPRGFDALHDYRRLPGQVAGKESYELRLQVRRAHQRRELAIDLYEMLEERPPVFSATASLGVNPEELGNQVRSLLGINYEEQSSWQSDYEALNRWRLVFEEKGILVFQAVDVELSEIRGFSISQTPLPAVVINIKDSPRARVFTMLHELIHVMLRKGGLCDLDEEQNRPPEEQRVEIFCNHIAGAVIVPKDRLLNERIVTSQTVGSTWSNEDIELLSRTYRASREVLLRRLLILGRITEAFYQRKIAEYRRAYEQIAEQQSEGFAPPYRMAISSAGPLFSRLVLETYNRERITASDVSEYLKIRLKHLPRIQREFLIGA